MPPVPKPSKRAPAGRPKRNLLIALAAAGAVAIVLIGASLALRGGDGSSTPSASSADLAFLAGIPQSGTVLGNPDAKVTMLQYEDIQCPVCKRYTDDAFGAIVAEYVKPGKVKLDFRGLAFLGPDSQKALKVVLAAAKQDKLWQLQEGLYRNQGLENSGWLTDDLIREVATGIPGLDVDKLFADAETDEMGQAAQQSAAEAQSAGITGTPTLLVKIGDDQPYLIQVATADQMREALDAALEG